MYEAGISSIVIAFISGRIVSSTSSILRTLTPQGYHRANIGKGWWLFKWLISFISIDGARSCLSLLPMDSPSPTSPSSSQSSSSFSYSLSSSCSGPSSCCCWRGGWRLVGECGPKRGSYCKVGFSLIPVAGSLNDTTFGPPPPPLSWFGSVWWAGVALLLGCHCELSLSPPSAPLSPARHSTTNVQRIMIGRLGKKDTGRQGVKETKKTWPHWRSWLDTIVARAWLFIGFAFSAICSGLPSGPDSSLLSCSHLSPSADFGATRTSRPEERFN